MIFSRTIGEGHREPSINCDIYPVLTSILWANQFCDLFFRMRIFCNALLFKYVFIPRLIANMC